MNGKIISEPEFKFFFNSKKYISKVDMLLKTEEGFYSLKQEESVILELIAYNETADYIYQNIHENDIVTIRGALQKGKIVVYEIL